jgi:hypothetical protein
MFVGRSASVRDNPESHGSVQRDAGHWWISIPMFVSILRGRPDDRRLIERKALFAGAS